MNDKTPKKPLKIIWPEREEDKLAELLKRMKKNDQYELKRKVIKTKTQNSSN